MTTHEQVRVWMVAAIGLAAALGWVVAGVSAAPDTALRDASEFASIDDPVARSKALFVEAGRVIQHPRCLNCHPTDTHPRQGDRMVFHEPPVVRGADGHGTAPMGCATCHQAENVGFARLPGHPDWHLAPLEMGWIGEPLGAICRQLKDETRNGGMDLEALSEHMAHDSLVGWAWAPGPGREPAPGSQAAFGRLIRAWIDSGAHCPDGEAGADSGPQAPVSVACSNCHDRVPSSAND